MENESRTHVQDFLTDVCDISVYWSEDYAERIESYLDERGYKIVDMVAQRATIHNKDYAEIALTINKMVHDECENVPHDIGWRIMEAVKDYFA